MTSPAPATILLVDDDSGVRGLVALALRREGFEVLEAGGGQAALDVVQTESVDLVVMDVGMPAMSGTEVVRTLRARSETATLPIVLITGSGDENSVIEGLEAGADDFLPKPVRLDELVARVRAHLRKQGAWSTALEYELRTRASVVAALGHLTISSVPVEAAEAIIGELAKRTDSDFVAVQQVAAGGQVQELATYSRSLGLQRGGSALAPRHARDVVARARAGPWVEEIKPLESGERTAAFAAAALQLAIGAPIYAGDDLVGLLTIGVGREAGKVSQMRRTRLLAAAIDYASTVSTMAGSAFAYQRSVAATRARLRRVLTAREFHAVFQPIVELETGWVVGYEALTRFDDGTAPDIRFAEAATVGLGPDFELATIRSALDAAARLPSDGFLSLNVSPEFVLHGGRRFRRLIKESTRPLILELTEFAAIDDYRLVRGALARLDHVGVAVDDAGAGYASLRHILELRPTYAKLDISLVRGIDGDELRQALAAGLQYFGLRSGFRIIAEGVESHEEADVLRRLGIELAQGYLFGRPEPANAAASGSTVAASPRVNGRRHRVTR
jgi:EAL domain-containing protein (putative c-di-GMP-specific phosphodiesterase class I)/DNA-binding response OmpR family regulator